MQILFKIINRIRVNKDLKPIDHMQMTQNIRTDLGLDSLDLAELTVRIENEFGIDVFEDGIVETVGEILEKLEQSK
jgi:acyl carrier protein